MNGFDPITQQITVEPVLPATPIVVCNAPFLSTLSKVERDIASLALATPQDAQLAAQLLQRLTTAGTTLEKARQELKAPFIAKGREIDAAAKAPADRIEAAKRSLKLKVSVYDAEQARIAAEAEAKRQAEIRRLEELKRKEDEERKRKADELERLAREQQAKLAAANTAPTLDVDFGDDVPRDEDFPKLDPIPPKTETELALEKAKFTPAVVAPKPSGIAWKSRLIISGIDITKLPDVFVTRTANETALRATFCTGWRDGDPMPECAGVTFKVDRQPVSTGRDVF
jgi:hypothetical protein